MSTEEKEDEKATRHREESAVMELKRKKSRCKSSFTRSKNQLLEELDNDEIDKEICRTLLGRLEENLDNLLESLNQLSHFYKETNRTDEMIQIVKEIESAEKQYENIVDNFHEITGKISDNVSVSSEIGKSKSQLGSDLWKQLKRVSIPVFCGDKAKYPAWKAAFYSCVDEAPSSDEYKMLQLRQYLAGTALNAIESLGHSSEAYKAAKERLERKFGGENRIVNRFLDELENFTPIKNESAKELEKFADLLDIAVINLKEAKHHDDLKNGSLYHRLLKKLPQTMLTRYHRQISEKRLEESVDILRQWVNEESEYIVRANEIIYGV